MDEAEIEQAIRRKLAERAPGETICPSEAARALADDWRPLMPAIRAAAARMAARGELVATQKGVEISPEAARGPIRLGARA